MLFTTRTLRTAAIAGLVVLATAAQAQGVAAFLDYMDRPHAFERGSFFQLENLPLKLVGLGDGAVFYTATNGDLKVFRDGRVEVLDRSASIYFTATDHLLGYKLATALKVYEDREMRIVCFNTGGWAIDDSLVAWVDEAQRTINVRYAKREYQLADALANDPILSWKTGDNIVAWVTTIENKLMAFYRGDIYELTPQANEVPYDAALDMVVFQDSQDNAFKVFLRGEVIELEPIMPRSWKVGKGVMAYIDQTGSLKVLNGSKVYTAYTYEPQEYFVEDSLVVIKDRDRIKVFANGQLQELENYWPERWDVSWGSLAYLDVNGAIKVWRDGRTQVALQRETFKDFTFDRNTLLVNMPNRKVKVWWNGEVYAH
jgi:hypothetical protein